MKKYCSLIRTAIALVALLWSSAAFCGDIHEAAKDGDLEKARSVDDQGATTNVNPADSFWKSGIVHIWIGKSFELGQKLLAIVLFLITTVAIMLAFPLILKYIPLNVSSTGSLTIHELSAMISGSYVHASVERKRMVAGLSSFFAGAIWFLLYWGFGHGIWWWVGFVPYLFIFYFISGICASVIVG